MPSLNFWGKLNRLREEIKLDDARKLKIRDYLIREMNSTVRANSTIRREERGMSLWNLLATSNFISNYTKKSMPIFASLVIAIMLGGGVSFAAENSLPGDTLYPVKVDVNEEVRGAFTFGAEAKAEWETRLAERRLEEAEQLTSEGRMNAETQANIEENFEAHSERVSERIAKFQAETNVTAAADVTSKFETSLRAHEQILRRLGDEASSEVKLHVRPVEAKVKARLLSAIRKRSELDLDITSIDGSEEAQADLKVSADGKINAAENVIASMDNFIENQKEKIGVQATTEAEARIQVARDLISKAKARVEAKSYGEAFNLAQQAIRVAQEARVLVRASTELNFKVRLIGPPVKVEIGDDSEVDSETHSTSSIQGKTESEGTETEADIEASTSGGGVKIEGSERLKIGL